MQRAPAARLQDAARELDVPVHTHAGGNLIEFQRIMDEYRKTPIQFLADIGFLDDRALIGHGVFTTAHPWSHYPFGDDVRVLAERGATVGHCPYKYAKMAMTLNSFQRYLDAGVNVAIGTDTFPMDMVAELRWASILAKVADANYQAGQHRDVFNAATLASCKFLHRDDLGRLAPGAKADIVLINLDHLGAGVYADPIKSLVDAGCGRDVDTVIVDGKILVQGGRTTQIDEDEVYAKARQATQNFWSHVPTLALGRRGRGPHHSAGVPHTKKFVARGRQTASRHISPPCASQARVSSPRSVPPELWIRARLDDAISKVSTDGILAAVAGSGNPSLV